MEAYRTYRDNAFTAIKLAYPHIPDRAIRDYLSDALVWEDDDFVRMPMDKRVKEFFECYKLDQIYPPLNERTR